LFILARKADGADAFAAVVANLGDVATVLFEQRVCGAFGYEPMGQSKLTRALQIRRALRGFASSAPMVAGARFELTTFGLCDLTQLSLRAGLYLHPK